MKYIDIIRMKKDSLCFSRIHSHEEEKDEDDEMKLSLIHKYIRFLSYNTYNHRIIIHFINSYNYECSKS
jgi:hypothetical protein